MVGFYWTPYPLLEESLRGLGPFRVIAHDPMALEPWTIRKPNGELYKLPNDRMQTIIKRERAAERRRAKW